MIPGSKVENWVIPAFFFAGTDEDMRGFSFFFLLQLDSIRVSRRIRRLENARKVARRDGLWD